MSKKFDIAMRQANNFIESAFAQEYSEQELKTMEFIISQTTKKDIELANNKQVKEIEISAQLFSEMIGANIKQIYRDAEDLSKALMNKKYHFKYLDDYGKPAFKMGSFLTDMEYKNGVIRIGINPAVLPYFVEINSHFTEFNLRYLVAMKSTYGIKLYKLLKQHINMKKKERELTIAELRQQFGINDTKYILYTNFKNKVIEVAVKHINLYTDIQVEYTENKLSRKVHSLTFFIKPKLSQYQQAKLSFVEWSKTQKNNILLQSLVADCTKNKQDPFHLEQVKIAFDYYLNNKIFNYDPNSCEPLQYYGIDTLFGS